MAATPPGGVKTRAYPLTLTLNHVGDPSGYPTIGSVDHVWVDTDTNMLMGEGKIDVQGEAGAEYARQLSQGMTNRMSIDPVEVLGEMRIFGADGVQLDAPEGGWDEESFANTPEGSYPVTTFADWTLAGLAAVPIPAYSQAAVEPVWGYSVSQALPSSAIVAAAGTGTLSPSDRTFLHRAIRHHARAKSLAHGYLSLPGAFHPAVIGMANDMDHDADDAMGAAQGALDADSATGPSNTASVPGGVAAIVAAAIGGQVFNADFFQDPHLDGPTPLRVTEEGHIYGHVRLSGTCFQYGGDKAKKGLCVQPPPTACNYAKFMVHTAKMSDGSYKPVGALTYGSGHESRGSLYASRAHYDDVSTMAAKVIAGEDEWGTWISGEVLSSVADRAYDLLLSPLSGHWEPDPDNRGHLEMMAAHIVVTPGYAVRHIVAGFGEDGETTSLIVTTWLPTEPIVASTQEEIAVTETPSSRATVVATLRDIERAKALANRMGIEDHRVARETARLERVERLTDQFATSGGIADPGTPWDGAAAEASVWAHGKNGKIDRGLASKVFLAHTGDGSKKGDWHLPVGRVVGGSVEIVPRGVSAAAGRVGQTQGIDQAAAKSKIAGLYSRIHAKYPAWPASPDA